MRIAFILATALTTVMLTLPQASAASRQATPGWCLNGGGSNANTGECVYRTLQQCLQDRTGEGGHCDPNPNAAPAASVRE